MAYTITTNSARRPLLHTRKYVAVERAGAAWQAYRVLHVIFTIIPLLAGVDKFLHLMTNWDQYLAPQIAAMLPVSAHTFMMGVGVVEIIAGLLVAFRPRVGAYVVGGWMLGIIINLMLIPGYFDVAARDFGLALSAFALGRLADEFSGNSAVASTHDRTVVQKETVTTR
jgi:hypothetical protein